MNPKCWEQLLDVRRRREETRRIQIELLKEEAALIAQCRQLLRPCINGELTQAEDKVLISFLENPAFRNKEIGTALGITERTVKFHMSNILAKFGVCSRRELLRNAKKEIEP